MAILNLEIMGKKLDLECAEGDEGKLIKLTAQLNSRLLSLSQNAHESNDKLLLIMTALMMQDEINEKPAAKTKKEEVIKEIIKEVEVIREVPVEVIKEIEVIKEVPVEVIKEVEVIREVVREVEVLKEIEIIKEVEVLKEVVREVFANHDFSKEIQELDLLTDSLSTICEAIETIAERVEKA